jgi:hypothetical protein
MDMMVNLSQGMAEDDFDKMCAPLLKGDDFVSVVTGWQQLCLVENPEKPKVESVKNCIMMAVGEGQDQDFIHWSISQLPGEILSAWKMKE